jgi:hypothetical protein
MNRAKTPVMLRAIVALLLSAAVAGGMLLASCATVPETGRSQMFGNGSGSITSTKVSPKPGRTAG